MFNIFCVMFEIYMYEVSLCTILEIRGTVEGGGEERNYMGTCSKGGLCMYKKMYFVQLLLYSRILNPVTCVWLYSTYLHVHVSCVSWQTWEQTHTGIYIQKEQQQSLTEQNL